ncbi:uncharacterized protein STEHIDRAFT_120852 [Stereum hirsutum FP-91666 SS1]|uniref:uncharacterized protein n=1 Tax=Stereum hirsutum (strain FP-91666) TaxID=721885 RepID=UPI000440E88E|nr:uncharacterized protein STEHIDRAFT_120852 [Stereum hirsutum FP-91666 SS1]EIM87126.1 hypothetical protein STEHIDRAFT_120852 [Stereum hirsutum FP-91666 SS1]
MALIADLDSNSPFTTYRLYSAPLHPGLYLISIHLDMFRVMAHIITPIWMFTAGDRALYQSAAFVFAQDTYTYPHSP